MQSCPCFPDCTTGTFSWLDRLRPYFYTVRNENRVPIDSTFLTFISEPARKKLVAKLQSATANEVIASLGQPYKIVDATNFTAHANEMAQEGLPISNADMTARGMVWLYPGEVSRNTDVRTYETVLFDKSNRVTGVYRTY